ncbi:MAG: hypothetical protein MJA83_17720 [Gammaproteobacteria bacterium]|nr:hypothetical protein [Gammaproteobacteria bacterium]
MGWTTPEVIRYVKAQLGHPKRSVELDNTNFSEALKRAVRYYSTKKPTLRHDFVEILNGTQKYDFVALNKPFGKGVITVYEEPITSPQDVFNEFEYYRLRQPPYVDIAELVIDNQYYKMIGAVTGTAPFDWEWLQDNSQNQAVLLVSPIPTRSHRASYVYDAEPANISEIRLNDQGWVVDYTLALAKEMLGRIRGKFQGIPSKDGPQVDTDWGELLSEAKEEKDALQESLWASRGDWTPPLKR